MTDLRTFTPTSGFKALLDQILEIKFSKHVPLVVVLLGAIYAVYRSTHYLRAAFHMPIYIAAPTAIFIEALVLAASAAVFISHRSAFVAELKGEDEDIAQWGVYLTLTLLGLAFAALLGVAWSDAWMMTSDYAASFLMVLAQAAQAGLIMAFIIFALLDERAKLRIDYKDYERAQALGCLYCGKEVAQNNRKRHMDRCPMNPKNAQP